MVVFLSLQFWYNTRADPDSDTQSCKILFRGSLNFGAKSPRASGTFKLSSLISENPDVGGQGQWKFGQLCLFVVRQTTDGFFLKSGQNLDRKIRTNSHRTTFFSKLPDRIGQRIESRQTESGQTDTGRKIRTADRYRTRNPDNNKTRTGHGQCCSPTSGIIIDHFEHLRPNRWYIGIFYFDICILTLDQVLPAGSTISAIFNCIRSDQPVVFIRNPWHWDYLVWYRY